MADIKLNQGLDPTFTRATTANKRDGSSVASGAVRYESVIDPFVINKERQWDAGTYTRCDASGNILTTEVMRPAFTRSSSGWIDGIAYDTNVPRYYGDVLEYGATNGFEYSEPTQTSPDAPGNSNISFTSDFGGVNGMNNCVTFGDNSVSRYVYPKNSPFVVAGKKYTISCYVKMDDGSAPTVSSAGGYDMAFVVGNSQLNHTISPATVTLVSGTVYRISATVTAAGTSANNGLLKAQTTHSSKGFKATGFQIEENPSVTSYIATAGAKGNRVTTYNKTGILIENYCNNLATRSAEFDNAAWLKDSGAATGSVSVTANAVYAPDGTLTADKIVEDSTVASGSLHQLYRNSIFTVGQSASLSVYARAGERKCLALLMDSANTIFDLVTGGIISTGSGHKPTMTYVGNGWYRCTVSKASVSIIQIGFRLCDNSANILYTGDGTSGLYLWGAQAEVGTVPTSYVPTTSAAVARQADSLLVSNKVLNRTAGTIIIRAKWGELLHDQATLDSVRYLFDHSNTAFTSNVLALTRQTSALQLYTKNSSGTQSVATWSSPHTTLSVGYHTFAATWSASELSIWADGSERASTTGSINLPTAIDQTFAIGSRVSSGPEWDEPIDWIEIFDTVLSDAELAAYTHSSGAVIPAHANKVYSAQFNNNLYFATSGIYVSEWLNAGVSGAVFASTTVLSTTPSGTSLVTEYRTSDSDTQTTASDWSTTLGTGKYVQFRHYLVNDGTTAYVPSVTSHTITPDDYGKCITIEESTTNLLTSPTSPATQDVTVTAAGDYNLSIYGNNASSGTCVIEHKKVETTTADFGTGTLNNVQGSSNALALATAKAAPSFTRATSATDEQGATITSGNTRYAFGKNLLTKNQSDVETNTSGFAQNGAGTVTLTRDTTTFWQGAACLKAVCDGTNANQGWYATSDRVYSAVPAASTITASAYVKGNAGGEALNIRAVVLYSDGTSTVSNTSFTATTSFVRYSNSVTGTAGKTISQVRVIVYATNATPNTFFADGIQIEVGSSATDWVQGGPHAVMIEEATTNLGPVNSNDFTTSWVGQSGSSGTITSGQVDPFGGSNAYRIVASGGTSVIKWYWNSLGTATNGQKYSGSVWVKANSATDVTARLQDPAGGAGNIVTGLITQTDGWKLVKLENMTGAGNALQMFFSAPTSGDTLDFYAYQPQVENKAYATTYIAPGTTRNAESLMIPSGSIFSNPSVGSVIARVRLDSINSDLQTILDVGGTGASGWILNKEPSNGKWRFQYGTGAGTTTINGTTTVQANVWYTVGVKWGPTGAKLYVNGVQEASGSVAPVIVASANFYFGCNAGSLRFLNGQLDTVALYREELTDAELASATASSGSIQLDRRTAYDLRFVNNLNHGEGGYRLTTGVALDNIRTIGGSTIDWTVSAATGSSGIIETSIDNGTTYSTATDGSSITGLTDGVSATGKTFICRQTLLTEDANSVQPTLTDIEYRITQKWENIPQTFIKPVYTTLRFTPTNLTKFQLENKRFATSFYNGTRNDDSLSISASGILNFASGTVIVRFYDDQGYVGPSTNTRTRCLFTVARDNSSSGVLYLYQVVNGATPLSTYIGSDSAALQTATKAKVLSKGWHTMAARWGNGNISLWCDGAFEASGVLSSIPTMTTGHIIKIGTDYGGGSQTGGFDISQVDIFGEALTDAEMIQYTAASGAVIPVTVKHSYQMKFEDNLEYGMTGIFYSRWHDAGSNTAGTPWVTYTKVENKPAGTDVKYFFGANDNQAAITTWTEDITAVTGRYLKTKICLMSDDVNAATPTVTSVRVFPQYS